MLLKDKALQFHNDACKEKYQYNFDYFGRPIIQFPQDILAIQQIILSTKPDLIIETGIAHGGSLILSASMLSILDYCEGIKSNNVKNFRKVIGIDIDIRENNKKEILNHVLSHKIKMIEGSSISDTIVKEVYNYASDFKKILVILDANHTYNHTIQELNLYAHLVSVGSYCIVCDTVIADMPNSFHKDRDWDKDNNPKKAVREFRQKNQNFISDLDIDKRLLISSNPEGFLKKIS